MNVWDIADDPPLTLYDYLCLASQKTTLWQKFAICEKNEVVKDNVLEKETATFLQPRFFSYFYDLKFLSAWDSAIYFDLKCYLYLCPPDQVRWFTSR